MDITTDPPPDAVRIFSLREPERRELFIKCATWLDERRVTAVIVEHPREQAEDTLLSISPSPHTLYQIYDSHGTHSIEGAD